MGPRDQCSYVGFLKELPKGRSHFPRVETDLQTCENESKHIKHPLTRITEVSYFRLVIVALLHNSSDVDRIDLSARTRQSRRNCLASSHGARMHDISRFATLDTRIRYRTSIFRYQTFARMHKI